MKNNPDLEDDPLGDRCIRNTIYWSENWIGIIEREEEKKTRYDSGIYRIGGEKEQDRSGGSCIGENAQHGTGFIQWKALVQDVSFLEFMEHV